MKPQRLSIVIALLTLAALVTAVLIKPKYGLDIQGGARVVLEADTSKLPQGQTWGPDTRSAVVRTIENRINSNGVSEPVISTKGDRQFVVEIPAIRNEQQVLEQLQNTAQLEFFYSPDWQTDRNRLGRYRLGHAEGATGSTAKGELWEITDNTTKQTFRDLYQINQDLRQIVDSGVKAGDKAKEVTLPPALAASTVAAGKTTLRIDPKDEEKIATLATETQNFNTFLGAAQLKLDGSDVLPTAHSGFDDSGRAGAVIELEFNDKGAAKFRDFTRDHTSEVLMIYLDGRILTAPNITEPILNGRAKVSGFATLPEAKTTADFLNGGALPVPLKIIQQQSIQATIGNEAVRHGLTAGAVGLLAVAVFMAAYYLLPGVIAVIALLLYTLFTYAIFVLIPVTFTLPGIAGFILSVGMAVDANILIFERTKEELRAGRQLRPAIEAGFGRAFSAIFDSNMCTAVTSVLLYSFGTGAVRGFALTLLIGVVVSMFTAITVTRTLLLLVLGSGAGKNLASWGVNRQIRPRLNVVGKRALWYGLSLAIIVPGIIFAFAGGYKEGIDFTGGSELTLRVTQPVTREQVEKAVAAQGIVDPSAQIAGSDTVFVRLPKQGGKAEVTSAEADNIVRGLQQTIPGVTREGFESIGSSISGELKGNALKAIFFSSAFIVIYLAFRFGAGDFVDGLKFGVSAIIAMLHDIAVLVGLFCVLGYFLNWKIDSLFVTAALTVIGFSVHDTIIIFDRIRENARLPKKEREGASFGDAVNTSINETFARSIFTSMTVIITLFALLIFGGPIIRPLNAALLIGIISGTYSSIFNAAPLVVDWQRLFGKKTVVTPERRPNTTPAAKPTRPSPASAADCPSPTPGSTGNNGGTGARIYPAPDGNGVAPQGDAAKPALPPGPPRPRRRRM